MLKPFFLIAAGISILVFCSLLFVSAGTLSCSISTTCSGGTVIMRLSSTSNAHSELPGQTNYSQLLCCSGVAGLGTSCSGNFSKVAGLSSTTNAHIEQGSLSNYSNDICLSVAAGTVSVGFLQGSCGSFDTALMSLSSSTNAQAGDQNAYNLKVCGTASSGGNSNPAVSAIAVNSGSAINLITNSTKTVAVTANVSDPDGVNDIRYATSTLFRSGVGAGCSSDNRNCYQISSSSCVFNVGTTTVTCNADVYYFAQSTDASSTYSTENWQGKISLFDVAGASGSSTASGVELNTLLAIDVSPSSISYGSLAPGLNTGATNQIAIVSNMGNSSSTLNMSGTDMSGPATINVGSQHYSANAFTYGAGDITLTTVPTAFAGFLIAAPQNTTPVTRNVYFGIGLGTIKTGSYSGTNTFTAVWTP